MASRRNRAQTHGVVGQSGNKAGIIGGRSSSAGTMDSPPSTPTGISRRPGAAAALARGLAVDGKTVAKYPDLMVDLLLVRRPAP